MGNRAGVAVDTQDEVTLLVHERLDKSLQRGYIGPALPISYQFLRSISSDEQRHQSEENES